MERPATLVSLSLSAATAKPSPLRMPAIRGDKVRRMCADRGDKPDDRARGFFLW
jgi:hypothetical protein